MTSLGLAQAAAKGERRNRFVARAHYKGDSYSLGVRASSGPSFGASGLASVTQNLALGGEAYVLVERPITVSSCNDRRHSLLLGHTRTQLLS